MDEELQKKLLEAAKKALPALATGKKHKELVYLLRDIIRSIEGNGPAPKN